MVAITDSMYGGQVRGFLHIEEYIPGAFALILGEICPFRLEFIQNLLDCVAWAATSRCGIARFNRD